MGASLIVSDSALNVGLHLNFGIRRSGKVQRCGNRRTWRMECFVQRDALEELLGVVSPGWLQG